MPNGWDGSTPTAQDDGAGTVYELGQDITVNQDLTITQVRVWHPPTSNTITDRAARFWTSGGGEIAAVPLSDALPSGWSTYALAVPLERAAGQQFVLSYSTRQFYGFVAGELPNTSADGGLTYTAGRFRGGAEAFPDTVTASFYGIDVVYDLGFAGNDPPIAGLSVSTSGLTATAQLSVVDETPGSVSYRVEWGDGTSTVTAGPTAMHTYAATGTYAVMVTATDAQGLQDSAALPVTVRSAAPSGPLVSFPDAEIAMLDYLRSALPGLVCDVEIPESYRADEGVFVCVRRAGGQTQFPVQDWPLYDIQVYAPTRDVGCEALMDVLARIAVARYAPPVTGVFGRLSVISGPQYMPDPVTDEDRWQALITIPLRGKRIP